MQTGFQVNALDPRSLSELQRLAREQPDAPETLRAATQQFEAMFLQMVLKAMRDATPQNGLFDSEHTRTYQSLLDQQLTLQMAGSRNNGMSEALFRQLGGLASQGAGPEGAQAPALNTLLSDVPWHSVAAVPARSAAALPGVPSEAAAEDDPIGAFIARLEAARNRSAEPVPAEPARMAAEASGAPLVPLATPLTSSAPAGSPAARREAFVREIWPHAQTASRATGIPARFIVAQAALETGWGEKILQHADGRSSYNVFNIKTGSSWQGDAVSRTVSEYANGVQYAEPSRFRSYASYAEAFQDYARLLSDSPRYAGVLGQTEATGFARSLQQAGYATDPRYADKLAGVIAGRSLNAALPA